MRFLLTDWDVSPGTLITAQFSRKAIKDPFVAERSGQQVSPVKESAAAEPAEEAVAENLRAEPSNVVSSFVGCGVCACLR
jgi:hypothetical protein